MSNAYLKPFLIPLAVVASFGFSPTSSAQDGRVTIVGELSDGTLPTPAHKPELPQALIRETHVVQLPDRKVTIHRIADPGLPDPRPKLPERLEMSEEQIEAFRKTPSVQRWLKEVVVNTSHLFISATVVDDRATFLRWWHDGEEYQAWSNSDWNILNGFAACQKGEKRFVLLQMIESISSTNLPANSPYHVPYDLPSEPGTYWITQGDLDNTEAYDGINALHELYISDYARLKQAHILREQRRKKRESMPRSKPSAPEDVVLRFWKVDRDEKNTVDQEGGAQ